MPDLPCQIYSLQSDDGRIGRRQARFGSGSVPMVIALIGLVVALTRGNSSAQNRTAKSLAEQSVIVVRGRVLKVNASSEPMLAPSSSTAVVSVLQMYAGKEVAGDQRGRTMTVILNRPNSVTVGEEALFFGNPRLLGRTVTLADVGEIPARGASRARLAGLEAGVQARKDRPVAERLASASVVFRGTVESVHPLDTEQYEAKRTSPPTSEHDPRWQVARVRIAASFRDGEIGQIATVVFSGSDDIIWFRAPKLKTGVEGIFLAQPANRGAVAVPSRSTLAALMEKERVYFVTNPFDVLPPTEESRVRGLLANQKEPK